MVMRTPGSKNYSILTELSGGQASANGGVAGTGFRGEVGRRNKVHLAEERLHLDPTRRGSTESIGPAAQYVNRCRDRIAGKLALILARWIDCGAPGGIATSPEMGGSGERGCRRSFPAGRRIRIRDASSAI